MGEQRILDMLELVERLHPGDDKMEFSISVAEAREMLAGADAAREEAALLVMARCKNRVTGAVLARLIRSRAPANADEKPCPVCAFRPSFGHDKDCPVATCTRCMGDGNFMGDPCTCIPVT